MVCVCVCVLSAKQDLLVENVCLNKLIYLNAFNCSSNLFNTSRFGKRAKFAHWAFLEHHKINQYMALWLILTESGQGTHWEIWKPHSLASGLRVSGGDVTTFTTLSL